MELDVPTSAAGMSGAEHGSAVQDLTAAGRPHRRRGRVAAVSGSALLVAVLLAGAMQSRSAATPETTGPAAEVTVSVPDADRLLTDPIAGVLPVGAPRVELDSRRPPPASMPATSLPKGALAAAGWGSWPITDATGGESSLPAIGYAPIRAANSPLPAFDTDPQVTTPRSPMYDAPSGRLIGYFYEGLGVVPLKKAESPGFDAEQLYRLADRCNGVDQDCHAARRDREAGVTR